MANLGEMNMGYARLSAERAQQAPGPKKPSEIGGVCERLERRLSESSGLVSALEEKLTPVLSVPQATAGTTINKMPGSNGGSPLADTLQEYAQRMENTNYRLNELINRFDL